MSNGKASLWRRFLSLFCCVSLQRCDEGGEGSVPVTFSKLSLSTLVYFVNCHLCKCNWKIANIKEMCNGYYLAVFVEGLFGKSIGVLEPNESFSSSKSNKNKKKAKKRKRMLAKVISYLEENNMIEPGRFSIEKITKGSCSEAKGLVVSLLYAYRNEMHVKRDKEYGLVVETSPADPLPISHVSEGEVPVLIQGNFCGNYSDKLEEGFLLKCSASLPVMFNKESNGEESDGVARVQSLPAIHFSPVEVEKSTEDEYYYKVAKSVVDDVVKRAVAIVNESQEPQDVNLG